MLYERVPTKSFQWRTLRRYYPLRLQRLLASKQEGEDIIIAPPVESVAPFDLEEALRASVKAERGRAPAKARG